MPKIPEFSVGSQMERSVSVSCDRNIRDDLWRWSTYFGRNIPTEIIRFIFVKPVHPPRGGEGGGEGAFHCPTSLHLCREFGKGINYGKSHS